MRQFILVSALLAGCAAGSTAAAAAPISNSPATPTATATPGWPGDTAQYLGRYRLTSSNNKKFAQHGQLTVFMRTFRVGVPPVISGILALSGKGRSNVFYLTMFSHSDTQLQAVVNLGSYAGPVIGQFVVQEIKGKTMQATFAVMGIRKTTLKLLHFSSNPHP